MRIRSGPPLMELARWVGRFGCIFELLPFDNVTGVADPGPASARPATRQQLGDAPLLLLDLVANVSAYATVPGFTAAFWGA